MGVFSSDRVGPSSGIAIASGHDMNARKILLGLTSVGVVATACANDPTDLVTTGVSTTTTPTDFNVLAGPTDGTSADSTLLSGSGTTSPVASGTDPPQTEADCVKCDYSGQVCKRLDKSYGSCGSAYFKSKLFYCCW
jgi:hypothetical protein